MDASLSGNRKLPLAVDAPPAGTCLLTVGLTPAICPSFKYLQQKQEETQKVRAYWFIVWPESIDMGKVFDILRRSGYAVAVSPLHDKDIRDFETGRGLAKPHYHIIVRFPTPRYLEPVRRLVGSWIYDA